MAFQCIKQFHLIMIEIIFYKYLLTKTIQDDFVNNELSHVNIKNNFDPSGKKTYVLHCTLKNGIQEYFT